MSSGIFRAGARMPGALVWLVGALVLVAPLGAQDVSLEQLDALQYRHIGPVGNRIASVAGVAGDPSIYYAGAASGGVWKTVDGGINWEPVFDDQDSHSIGALAVAPSDPEIVWAGTGEPHIRSNVTVGDGVYKSTDGGRSWTNMGLESTGRISKVVVHPTNPDIVYAASLGHTHGPQSERGIYRTRDGGETWEQVLTTGANAGASELVMDPNNPRILFAGMWQVTFNTWGRQSGGENSGLFVSRDGGDSWTELRGNGLPERPIGKVGLCTTRADSHRIYALLETGDGVPWHGRETGSGELWRSDDGGRSWALVNHSRDLGGRTAYYNRCAASPDDPDEAYFLTADFFRTLDGGESYREETGLRSPGWDTHAMWIDPTNADRMIVGSDGGIGISENRGETWLRAQLPIAQMYHVTVDTEVPYNVLGNRQDGPSVRGPSNSRTGSTITRGMWHGVGGGESGFATPDPENPNIIWSSASGAGAGGGIVVRYNEETRQYRDVTVWPASTTGWPADGVRYRFQWTFPLKISPHDHNTVYVTSQHVHRTRNGGQSWDVVSPDLTTNDTSRMGISGGLTPDNIGVEYCCVIYAFDESPVQEGVLWAGTNDGLVHVSRDGGQSWTEVTGNLPDLPRDGVVRSIDASRWEAGKAYLAIEFHQVGNFDPYVYRTTDFGESWTKITDGIDDSPLSFTRWIHEDPVRPGLVYLGTENKVYVTFDDGDSWQSLMTNLPPAPMYGLIVQEHFNDLVVGTYGRGFWILDDITPLQQLTPEVVDSDAHLFEPRRAYRFHERTSPMSGVNDPSAGENPPYGASINYWLGSVPQGDVTVRIRNDAGETIRTLDGTKRQGLNRLWWDLNETPSKETKLRTAPPHADWVDLGDDRVRTSGSRRITILAPPGSYTVELEVDGRTVSRSLEVVKDPHSEGTMADIRVQTAMLRELRSDLEEAVDMVNRIESVRRQAYDLRDLVESGGLTATADRESLTAAVEELDEKLIGVEGQLLQLKRTGTGQDGVRWPSRLTGRLSSLAQDVATADFPPTDQQRDVHAMLQEELRAVRSEYDAVMNDDVAVFNQMLQRRELSTVTEGYD